MGFDLGDGVEADADHDQQRRSTEEERNTSPHGQQRRQHADYRHVEGAHQCDAGQHAVDVFGGPLARADARNVSTRLLDVLGHVHGIDHDGRVEVTEEDDQPDVEELVDEAARIQVLVDEELDRGRVTELADRKREHQ